MRREAEIIGTARIAARRRAVRRDHARARRRIATGVTILAAIAYGLLSLTGSSVFRLDHIEVAGDSSVGAQRVIDASGLRVGESALALDLDAAAASVRGLPEIADARVERVGSLGVRIVVTERRPVVEVRAAGRSYFFDVSGRLLDGKAPKGRLPVMRAQAIDGGAPVLDASTIQSVVSFWQRAGSIVRDRTDEVMVDDGTLSFRAGETLVLVGSLDGLRAKLEAVRSIWRRARDDHRRVTFIDVRTPGRPAARIG